jgi:hypothetical protein
MPSYLGVIKYRGEEMELVKVEPTDEEGGQG